MNRFKPCLLHETAEIALTEIKRYLEPRLMDEFQLRRVSAPLFLPVGSPLIDPRHRGATVSLHGAQMEVEIVGGLDLWLRRQLRRYDAAPGFGVFTIMNAIRPDAVPGLTTAVHIAAWAWQQTVDPAATDATVVASSARRLYTLLLATEKRLLEMFPHMHPTLHKNLDILTEDELAGMMPGRTRERSIYEYLHPDRADRADNTGADGRHCASVFICRSNTDSQAEGELWVWNRRVNRPLLIADLCLWHSDDIGPASVGGNIFRNQLAMQLLHQDSV